MAGGLDETTVFQPRFDAQGLIPAIVTDSGDGTVLMFAHMNAEALKFTLDTGIAHFWSRSRGKLWKKGETSGEVLAVAEILTDCDQDVVQIKAVPQGRGAACHRPARESGGRWIRGRGQRHRLTKVGWIEAGCQCRR